MKNFCKINNMVLKQINIFGEYKQPVIKSNKKNVNKKDKNEVLKIKINILYKMYQQLYEKMNINFFNHREIIIKNNIIIYPEEQQAEPIELINMNLLDDIDKRINKMKEILNV